MDEARRNELEAVYRATNYVVYRGTITFVIRIGDRCTAADEILGGGENSWAFMTAWNPYSQELSANENSRRQSELQSELNLRGLRYLAGAGEDPRGEWPSEDSLLVVGIGLDDATTLAKIFEQNAIVFGRRGQPAELVWCV